MPGKPLGRCPSCGTRSAGRCASCAAAAERRRGSAADRGYTGRGHRAFRAAVLTRDPVCVICRVRPAKVADHYPLTRRELVARGLDPNDPARGRGLCASCHGAATAADPAQRGGWNRRE